jgi:exodeoxyribonuclease X
MASWRSARYLVLDTETTGLDPVTDRVVEVAATWVDASRPEPSTPCFQSLVNPERSIPPEASAIHHLTAADVAGAPVLNALVPALRDLAAHADVLVAHHAAFDRVFLPDLGRPWFCTLRAARHLWPRAPRHSNQVLRYWIPLTVTAPQPHRAADDTVVTAALLRHLLGLPELDRLVPGSGTGDLVAWADTPIRLSAFPFGKYKGVPLSRVPRSYVEWALATLHDMDADLAWTLRQALVPGGAIWNVEHGATPASTPSLF